MDTHSPRRAALLNWLQLDRAGALPLYAQIGNQIRDAILRGSLPPGSYIPSSRALARDLGISRITALQAYERLAAEGYLETLKGSGTRVTASLSPERIATLAAARNALAPTDQIQKHLQSLSVFGEAPEPTNVAFQPGIPAFDAFPRPLWSKLLAREALRSDPFLLGYADVGGYARLRAEIAAYLQASRGVLCDAEQVLVVTSVRAAIAAVCAVLWPPRSVVVVEDPGYQTARLFLAGADRRLHTIPVDDQGIMTSELPDPPSHCVGAYVTPAHHWPTGVALAAERRLQLLAWAVKSDAWIIEDDYDSEFRFGSRPLGTLYALGSGRVIYVGTFSKTFAPSIRTAYLVVPHDLVSRFEKHIYIAGTEPPLHVQAALATVMAQGDFTRHIARMRKLYAGRRDHLVGALRAAVGSDIALTCPPGGLQIIATLPDRVSAAEVSERASKAGLVVRTLESYYVRQAAPNALHLGFAAIPEPEISPAVGRLRAILADLL